MATFGERFKNLRHEYGLSQEEIAAKLKVSRSCIGNYEQDLRTPGRDVLDSIADFFNVDADYLLGKQNERTRYAHDFLTEDENVLIEIYRKNDTARLFLKQYCDAVWKEVKNNGDI